MASMYYSTTSSTYHNLFPFPVYQPLPGPRLHQVSQLGQIGSYVPMSKMYCLDQGREDDTWRNSHLSRPPLHVFPLSLVPEQQVHWKTTPGDLVMPDPFG